ncbi:uncharacterized protein LOC116617528 [Nematostella vectensis]|uniref:uncharacterized protein LOC116617528 n=1 Tax=Nematostella vectensis TaxID=45351 RepID=UPI00138FC9AC|nr:uncharacterized protein LOC116617528 [Nematostella vectensis]
MKTLLMCVLITLLTNSLVDGRHFEPIGCFQDRNQSRALPELLANYRPLIKWKTQDFSEIVSMCAEKANQNDYQVFGMQFYGECWSGPSGGVTYDEYGPSDNCVQNASRPVGKDWANFVYYVPPS